MKVALIAESLDTRRGGAETSTLQFLQHLLAAGVDLHVVTGSDLPDLHGLAVHRITPSSLSKSQQTRIFARRAKQILAEHPFDLVHAISPLAGADIYQPRGGTMGESIRRNVALRRGRVGRWIKRTALQVNPKIRHLLATERLLMREGGPMIVAISDYVVRQLEQHYGVAPSRIRKIYNGVDLDEADVAERRRHRAVIREKFGIADDDLLIIEIAHNFKLKGLATWLRGMAKLRSVEDSGGPRVRSLVIGRGSRGEWHRQAQRLGLGDVLTFVGATDQVAAFRHAADVLVHPTHYDPCSRVVLEALSGGLPTISTMWDGASEMIEHGVNGYVLQDANDAGGLAHLVRQLADPAVRKRMSEAAAKVGERISMARHAEQMLALYDEVVRNR